VGFVVRPSGVRVRNHSQPDNAIEGNNDNANNDNGNNNVGYGVVCLPQYPSSTEPLP
jgi:hypothetical protein